MTDANKETKRVISANASFAIGGLNLPIWLVVYAILFSVVYLCQIPLRNSLITSYSGIFSLFSFFLLISIKGRYASEHKRIGSYRLSCALSISLFIVTLIAFITISASIIINNSDWTFSLLGTACAAAQLSCASFLISLAKFDTPKDKP